MAAGTVLRYLGAAPASAVGLVLAGAACAFGASARVVDGVIEIAGTRSGTSASFVAITFGHVVLGRSHAVLAEFRAHEHEHVRQYERWGTLFILLYLGSSTIQWLRGARPYWDNRFERQARAAQRRCTTTRSSG
jgi:hypothetical protein